MQDDGKSASRFSTKPSGGFCAVLPLSYLVDGYLKIEQSTKRKEYKSPCDWRLILFLRLLDFYRQKVTFRILSI